MVFGLPVLPDPSPRLLKIRGHIKMLLFPGNIRLNPTSSMAPFLNHCSFFLVSTFVGEFFVLTINPELLKLLFPNLPSRLIRQIVGFAFESVFLVVSCGLV